MSAQIGGRRGALVRRWSAIDPVIVQPALDSHYLTVHLGGAKRVARRGEGRTVEADMAPGTLSLTAAGSEFVWSTLGPVDFAHVYLTSTAIEAITDGAIARDDGHVLFASRLGFADPLLRELALAMLAGASVACSADRTHLDALLLAFALTLRGRYAEAGSPVSAARHWLAPARLRRVIEFIEANLHRDIGLADLAAVAGCSPFHFSRAFAASTGLPPCTYLLQRRLDLAKRLLGQGQLPVKAVASACGYATPRQLGRMFRRETGATMREFARHH